MAKGLFGTTATENTACMSPGDDPVPFDENAGLRRNVIHF
jgi:hypothetical protein